MTSIKEELCYKRFLSFSFFDTYSHYLRKQNIFGFLLKREREWFNTEILLCISKLCHTFFFFSITPLHLIFFLLFQNCASKIHVLYRLTEQVYFLLLGIYYSCVEEVVPGTKYVKVRASMGNADMCGNQLQGLRSRTSCPTWPHMDIEDLENRENERWVCFKLQKEYWAAILFSEM